MVHAHDPSSEEAGESQGQCQPSLGSEPHKPINPTEKLGDQATSVSLSVLILKVEFRVWYVTGKRCLKGEMLTVGSTEYSS